MTKIGLLSDTHGYIDPKIFKHFKDVDEIWHAGDVGTIEVIEQLRKFKPLRGVYGNIDGAEIRSEFKEIEKFNCENVKVLMTHIAGKPGKYQNNALKKIKESDPNLFVCGHSHILHVSNVNGLNTIWMNPGSCGNKGFHQVKTILRFSITDDKIHDLEAIELGKRI